MAFDIKKIADGYGTGELGVVTNPPSVNNINCYGQVIELTSNTIKLGEISSSQYCSFKLGATIMVHASLGDAENLGLYVVCKITNINGKVITVDKDLSETFPNNILEKNVLQAIVSADFKALILEDNSSISPMAFDLTKGIGGILFIRCQEEIQLIGGHINLTNKGIPIEATAQQRPTTAQETNENIADTGKYAGWENHITVRRFLLNRGCGALFLISPSLLCSLKSRIGDPENTGEHFSRTNICGGSTILMACDSIWNFRPELISKASPKGYGVHPEYGFARCYIASNEKLINDEGLYAYDVISNKNIPLEYFNIHNFGNGSLGECTNPTKPLNNYARIESIGTDTRQITVSNMTTDGLAQFKVGGLVMLHVSNPIDASYSIVGNFFLARIEAIKNDLIFLDTALSSEIIINYYSVQLITIPEFTNLTISSDYTYTPKWDGKVGGICAVAVNNICDLSNGKINVMCKGGANPYGKYGYWHTGNTQDCDKLPLGEGHGSVFILANTLKMNEKTRIGATYSGANFGGCGYNKKYNLDWNSKNCSGGGYKGKTLQGTGGWPGTADPYAGYGSNGQEWKNYNGIGYHGAHIMIIADTIDGFNQSAISTGGSACATLADGYCGGAGYGGGSADAEWGANGGGYIAGGGNGSNDDNLETYNANIQYKQVPVYRTETYTYTEEEEQEYWVPDNCNCECNCNNCNCHNYNCNCIPSFAAGLAVWGGGFNAEQRREQAQLALDQAALEGPRKVAEVKAFFDKHSRSKSIF